jgi:hypothetical protein
LRSRRPHFRVDFDFDRFFPRFCSCQNLAPLHSSTPRKLLYLSKHHLRLIPPTCNPSPHLCLLSCKPPRRTNFLCKRKPSRVVFLCSSATTPLDWPLHLSARHLPPNHPSIMPSHMPSSFASAAAGQSSGRDRESRTRGDGRGSGDWYVCLPNFLLSSTAQFHNTPVNCCLILLFVCAISALPYARSLLC